MAYYNKQERDEALKAIHDEKEVYKKVNGANSEIVIEDVIVTTKDGERKIPVTTKNFNREENHFEFGEAVFQEATPAASGSE